VPEQHDLCLTCSDAAVAARVVAMHDDAYATVDSGCGPARVSVALVDARVGGVVLVHAGEAIGVLDAEARR
jgi:hydrogenase expression/formation protein HypC